MAADLSIHIFTEGLTTQDLRDFFSHTLDSKYFSLRMSDNSRLEAAYSKIAETPQIWIGSVSWLKAALFDDAESYVPNPVAEINALIGEDLPIIDDDLIAKIDASLRVENQTEYSIAKPEEVRAFLGQYRGARAFTVSW